MQRVTHPVCPGPTVSNEVMRSARVMVFPIAPPKENVPRRRRRRQRASHDVTSRRVARCDTRRYRPRGIVYKHDTDTFVCLS